MAAVRGSSVPYTPRRATPDILPPLQRVQDDGYANKGQLDLREASTWLSSDARDGKRKNIGGTYVAPHSARQPTAGSTRVIVPEANMPLTARSTVSEAKDMHKIGEAIARKAATKYSNTRAALRYVDADKDGWVSRSELRYFFRAYDYTPDMADRFFDYLRGDQPEIDYEDFVLWMSPHFEEHLRPGSPSLMKVDTSVMATTAPAATTFSKKSKPVSDEFKDVLETIGRKAAQKFGTLRHAWRYVDTDHDGQVTRSEMQAFFRAFNLPTEMANRFFDHLDEERLGEIDFHEFVRYMAPYVQPENPSVNQARRGGAGDKHDLSRTWHPTTAAPKFREKLTEEQMAQRAELAKLMADIGKKLPLKFKHTRDAFRVLDLERNGYITRSEMRGFFRGFGHGDEVADGVFNMLDISGREEVEFKEFMKNFDSVLGPQFRQAKREPLISMEDKRLEKEVNDIARLILDRLTTKYKSVHDAFRAVDLNKDGTISRSEMHTFFRNFGMPFDIAEKFFKALDVDCSGAVQYDEFIQMFGTVGAVKVKKTEDSKPPPQLWRLYGGAAHCL